MTPIPSTPTRQDVRHRIVDGIGDVAPWNVSTGVTGAEVQRRELKNTGYEIFIGILSMLSIFNLVLLYAIDDDALDTVLWVMNAILERDLPGRLHVPAPDGALQDPLLLPPVRLG